jgi:hypothetical protein
MNFWNSPNSPNCTIIRQTLSRVLSMDAIFLSESLAKSTQLIWYSPSLCQLDVDKQTCSAHSDGDTKPDEYFVYINFLANLQNIFTMPSLNAANESANVQ